MASEIRVNQIQNRSGLSTVTFSESGVVLSGITTISDLRTSGNTIVAAGSTSAPSISPTGDSNTGIFFPSADTIAFAEGGAEAARFDSNGRLGIGTINPGEKLHIGQGRIRLDEDWQITWLSTAGTQRTRIAGDSGSNFIIETGASNIEKLRVTSGGDVQIANGNLVFSTSGKGIDFSATANSSGTMTSELLSDYEEGTWTPGIFDSATGTKTVSSSQGWYTKIGRMVYLGFALNNLNSSTSGDAAITGIPFTSASINQVGACFIADVSGVTYASGYGDIYGRINAAANDIQLLQKTTNGTTHTSMFGGSLGTGLVLRGMCMYIV